MSCKCFRDLAFPSKCRCYLNEYSVNTKFPSAWKLIHQGDFNSLLLLCQRWEGQKGNAFDFTPCSWCSVAPAWQHLDFGSLCSLLPFVEVFFVLRVFFDFCFFGLFFCLSVQHLELSYYYKIHSFGLMLMYRFQGGGGGGWHRSLRNVLKAWITVLKWKKQLMEWIRLLNTREQEGLREWWAAAPEFLCLYLEFQHWGCRFLC